MHVGKSKNVIRIFTQDYLVNFGGMCVSCGLQCKVFFDLQDRAFFSSDRLTWVDFTVFDWLETNVEFAAYDFGPKASPAPKDILDQYPRLNNFYKHFLGRPNIYKYRNSKKRLAFKVPNMPKY